MTPAQLRLLQRSFAMLKPHSEQFGAIFYERLFILDPGLRKLFPRDMKAQQSKFMKVIEEVVRLHLRSLISLPVTSQVSARASLPGAYWSGKLHAAYGVRMVDFETMKEALLWALGQILRSELTAEIAEAWVVAYDILARALREGMESWEAEEGDGDKATPLAHLNGALNGNKKEIVNGGAAAEEVEVEATEFLEFLDGRTRAGAPSRN